MLTLAHLTKTQTELTAALIAAGLRVEQNKTNWKERIALQASDGTNQISISLKAETERWDQNKITRLTLILDGWYNRVLDRKKAYWRKDEKPFNYGEITSTIQEAFANKKKADEHAAELKSSKEKQLEIARREFAVNESDYNFRRERMESGKYLIQVDFKWMTMSLEDAKTIHSIYLRNKT